MKSSKNQSETDLREKGAHISSFGNLKPVLHDCLGYADKYESVKRTAHTTTFNSPSTLRKNQSTSSLEIFDKRATEKLLDFSMKNDGLVSTAMNNRENQANRSGLNQIPTLHWSEQRSFQRNASDSKNASLSSIPIPLAKSRDAVTVITNAPAIPENKKMGQPTKDNCDTTVDGMNDKLNVLLNESSRCHHAFKTVGKTTKQISSSQNRVRSRLDEVKSDDYSSIILCDVDDENREDITQTAAKIFKQHDDLEYVAQALREWLNFQYEGLWQVVILRGEYWCSISHLPSHNLQFKVGNHIFLLWKTPY